MNTQATELRTYLDQVLRQWRMTIFLQGLSIIVAVGVLFIGLSLAADYMVNLTQMVRTILFIACLGILGVVLYRYLILPLRHVPTELQIARYVEERYPELNDAFVSAIEFENQPMEGMRKAFLDKLLAHVSDHSAKIDFRHVVDRKRLHRSEGLAVLALVLLTVFAMQDIDLFGRTAMRLATPWDRSGPLMPTDVSVEPGDVRIPRGGNQTIIARLGGKLLPQARLFSRQENQDEWYPVDMFETEIDGTFTYELTGIVDHTEYYVNTTSTKSPTFKITVYDPPYVDRIDVAYRYPRYTGLAAKTEEDRGDITAPIGTTVTLTITASKPVETGSLTFSNEKKMALETDEVTLTGSFTVREDLSYTINLLDRDNLPNSNPVEYYIRALPDREPRVTIIEPGRDTKASPIDEVLIRAEAEDDFGLSAFSLSYSINGGEEKEINLKGETSRGTVWDGEYMVYLEELAVQPGDFISYYATASDRRGDQGTTSTDLYFLEVKPFEEIYRQGSGGGGRGGGGGVAGFEPGRLTQQQKEIVSATWRVKRNEKRATAEQTSEDLGAIAEAQDAVRTKAEETMTFMRFQGGMDEEVMKMADILEEALEPMEKASEQLRIASADKALPLEREALTALMRVDALVREYMIVNARNQMASGAPLDLSDTSELELKDDDNKYETPDQASQAQQQNKTIEESLNRVKELARRQQQLNNQMRQMADNDRQSESERRRELDRLTREQRQLRQQAEEMFRQLSQMSNNPQQQQQRSQDMNQSLDNAMNGLRQGSEEMGQSAQQLQRNNPRQAAGQGSQALQRLEDATQQLQRAQGQSLEQLVRNAVQRADRLATRQEQLSRAVDELKKEEERDFSGVKARIEALSDGRGSLSEADKGRQVKEFVRKQLRDVVEAKEQTRQELERLRNDLEYLTRRANQEQPRTAEATDKARRSIDEGGLDEKIERSKGLLNSNSLERSARAEQDLEEDLKQLAEQVRTAQESLIMPDQDQLAQAQAQARNAMTDWQNVQRQLDRMNRGIPDQQSLNRLSQDYQQQLQQLQDLSNQTPQNTPQGQQLRDQLNRATALGNEPWKIDRGEWHELHQGIASALLDVHRGIRNQLQNMTERERLHMARDEEVPAKYRDLVNKYYENLSKDNRD